MDFMTFAMFAVLALIISVVLIGLYFVLRGGQKKRTSQKPVAGREGLVVAARLVRDKQTGLLLVVMDGNLYTRVSELSAGQRQRLTDAAHDLHKWLGLTAEAPASEVVPVPHPAAQVPAPVARAVAQEMQPPVKPVSTNPLEALRHRMGPSKPAPAFVSITSQINTILQGMLIGTPLEHRGISLTESPNVGVVVHVGMEQYPGIDDVPDEEVRKLIRAAVAEWERQNR